MNRTSVTSQNPFIYNYKSTCIYIYIYVQHPSAIELAGAPPHVQNLLQAIHRDTWFVVDDQSDVVRTELGPRPGDGFADVVFGFLWEQAA